MLLFLFNLHLQVLLILHVLFALDFLNIVLILRHGLDILKHRIVSLGIL